MSVFVYPDSWTHEMSRSRAARFQSRRFTGSWWLVPRRRPFAMACGPALRTLGCPSTASTRLSCLQDALQKHQPSQGELKLCQGAVGCFLRKPDIDPDHCEPQGARFLQVLAAPRICTALDSALVRARLGTARLHLDAPGAARGLTKTCFLLAQKGG